MSLQPGWVDDFAKTMKPSGEIQKVNTDPASWESLRRLGKKPFVIDSDKYRESRKKGGLKGARVKQALSKRNKI